MSECCQKCGSSEFAVARDMIGTRHCKCGHTWVPSQPAALECEAVPSCPYIDELLVKGENNSITVKLPEKLYRQSHYDFLAKELERLKTENKALKGNWAGTWIDEDALNKLQKALEFYAAPSSYQIYAMGIHMDGKHAGIVSPVHNDGGRRAREALKVEK